MFHYYLFFKLWWNTHNIEFTILSVESFLSIQYSGTEYIHILAQHILGQHILAQLSPPFISRTLSILQNRNFVPIKP